MKNRRKDGRYYWVRAYVTPIMEGRKPPSAICRCAFKPFRRRSARRQSRCMKVCATHQGNRYLHAGRVRQRGLMNQLGKLQRASFTQRLMALLAPVLVVALLFPLMGWHAGWQIGVQAALLLALTGLALYRQHISA